MLAAERALREGLELGPHAPALPPIAQGGGRGGGPLPPEPLLPHMQGGGLVGRPCISPMASYHVIWALLTVFSAGQTLDQGHAPPEPRAAAFSSGWGRISATKAEIHRQDFQGFSFFTEASLSLLGAGVQTSACRAFQKTKQGHQCSAVGRPSSSVL